jgi:hypothetical protein
MRQLVVIDTASCLNVVTAQGKHLRGFRPAEGGLKSIALEMPGQALANDKYNAGNVHNCVFLAGLGRQDANNV